MKYYKFRVDAFFPPEFYPKYQQLLQYINNENDVEIQHYVEESAPPPELVKEIIFLTAASLTILRHLYYFYQEIKNKKGETHDAIPPRWQASPTGHLGGPGPARTGVLCAPARSVRPHPAGQLRHQRAPRLGAARIF